MPKLRIHPILSAFRVILLSSLVLLIVVILWNNSFSKHYILLFYLDFNSDKYS